VTALPDDDLAVLAGVQGVLIEMTGDGIVELEYRAETHRKVPLW
jgi:hypothetical protein